MRRSRARRSPSFAGPYLLLVAAALLQSGCGTSSAQTPTPDPRVVLRSHLSHGIGASPFDSPLVYDSLGAAVLVSARKCAPVDRLVDLAGEPDRGRRTVDALRSSALLEFRAEQACSAFPILVGEERAAYATLARELAGNVHVDLEDELATLIREVEARGWTEWGYHFVWSQLFDSQFAWTEMMQRGLVPPLGHLIAWAIYPDHPFRSGTNYFPDTELRDRWVMVTWRADGANTVALIGGIWEAIYDAISGARSLTEDERAQLGRLDLLDERGRPNVPVLLEGDPLLNDLRALAARYIAYLEQRIPLDSLVVLTGASPQEAFAMAYHDASWEIVSRLVASGRVATPPALGRGPPRSEPSMRGVAAMVPVYAPFAELIREALLQP